MTQVRNESTLRRKPRLLFLARPFPPLVGGSVRTVNIARFLVQLGWDVTVVTPDPSVWRHVEDVEKVQERIKRDGIRRILTDHSWRCLAPESFKCRNNGVSWLAGGLCRTVARRFRIDNGIGWVRAAEQACSSLTSDEVDVILASGSPFAAFGLAKRLSDRLARPYVLDYRDPWTGNPHVALRSPKRIIREEAHLLRNCAAATVVSSSWAQAMHDAFGVGSKLHVIPNGYDPQELETVHPLDFGHFAIVYLGIFYPPKRVISPVMAALQKLNATLGDKCSPWYFHYYGREGAHVLQEATRFGVMNRVVLEGTVSREKALAAVRGANVAVVITSVLNEDSNADRGVIPGKIFEALGLKTPVLLICPAGADVSQIIVTTQAGAVFCGSESAEIANFLSKLICRQIQFNESSAAQEWSWPRLINRFDSILRNVMN